MLSVNKYLPEEKTYPLVCKFSFPVQLCPVKYFFLDTTGTL